MRTLNDIVAAVRSRQEVTEDELRYAVVAFDVLLSQMDLTNDLAKLTLFFEAAEQNPRTYIGEANNPDKQAAVEWYTAMQAASTPPMVEHHCPVKGEMSVEAGKQCNWCGG